jgi:hypothetical protein
MDLDSHTSIRTLNHLCLHSGDIICRLVDQSDQQLLLLLGLLLMLRLLLLLLLLLLVVLCLRKEEASDLEQDRPL